MHNNIKSGWILSSLFLAAVQSQTPTVITRPEALITSSGNVVEGSVIQVYCTVEKNNDISFTWILNGTTLLNDPPHIRIRTNTDGTDTTSVLTVDNLEILTMVITSVLLPTLSQQMLAMEQQFH